MIPSDAVVSAVAAALDELRAVLCGVGIVGNIEGHDVIRRGSVIDLVDRRRASLSSERDGVSAADSMRAVAPPGIDLFTLRDAARYRWLRKQAWYGSSIACVMNPRQAIKLGHDCPSLERLDAAIDAAMPPEADRTPSDGATARTESPKEPT